MERHVNGYRVTGNHLAHVGGREYRVEDSSGVVFTAEGKVAACDWAEKRKPGDLKEPVVAAPEDPVVETEVIEEPHLLLCEPEVDDEPAEDWVVRVGDEIEGDTDEDDDVDEATEVVDD